MNLPKFIKDDERLFRLLLGDLFPSLELPVPEYGALQVSRVTVKRDQTRDVRRKTCFNSSTQVRFLFSSSILLSSSTRTR